MVKTGLGLNTSFAPPERADDEEVKAVSAQLREEPLLAWFDAVPTCVVILNEDRQILCCNEAFQTLSLKPRVDDVVGMRLGEALDCTNANREEAGCGCSRNCDVCGAANAIVKSLEGEPDCQECRLMRMVDNAEVPLDLQVFTKPVEFQGQSFTLLCALDISHELRLNHQNRTFYHDIINTAGGITALADLIEADDDSSLFPLLVNSSRRILREALYHRDVYAAEQNRLLVNVTSFEAEPYFRKIVEDECATRNMAVSFVDMDIACEKISSDKRIVQHIVRNMLANALEAKENGVGDIKLKCWQDEAGTTHISMKNEGEMPENIKKQMFLRYVSTKSNDRGLGTYVMKLLAVKNLKGNVEFTSENGETCFTVSFPPGVQGIIPAGPLSGS